MTDYPVMHQMRPVYAAPKWWHFVLAFLIPIIGIVLATLRFARGQSASGVAVLLTAAVGICFIVFAMYGA
jgi:hypothetical protein